MSEVSTAGADQKLVRVVEELKRELSEAHRREAATAEVLCVIGSSPSNVQPVFDTIVTNAAHLCDAAFSAVAMFEGGLLQLVAVNKMSPEETKAYHTVFPRPPDRHFIMGRAFVDRQPAHVADIEADPDYDPRTLATLKTAATYRSFLGIPILRGGVPIGAIGCGRREVKPFTESEITLVKTFADQAVIAIENTRLFEEVQEKNRTLTKANVQLNDASEEQTATSEILRIISNSPTDTQPTFYAIAECATRLCDAINGLVFRYDGELLHLAAHHNVIPERLDAVKQVFPRRANIGSVAGRVAMRGAVTHVEDITLDADYALPFATTAGYRSVLGVPMLREGVAIGVILVAREHVAPFSNKQIKLLQTFADQAVIAIENTRLFEAEQASKRELQESLEYQTAMSAVLNVISRSPTDVQPVFEAIAQSAARLCNAEFCHVFRFDGELIHFAAVHGLTPEGREALRSLYPMPPGRATAAARSILTGTAEEIPDVGADLDYAVPHSLIIGFRSVVAAPMLKDGRPIGVIAVMRSQTGHFPERQIQLLKTFADQAVIAIENTRLFEEVQARTRELTESLEYQTATSEVLNVISRSPSELRPVVNAIVQTARRLCLAERAIIWRLREGKFDLLAYTMTDPSLVRYLTDNPIPAGRASLSGRAVLERRAIHVPDISVHPELGSQDQARAEGLRTLLAVPLLREGEPIGALALSKKEVQPFTDKQIELVTTFADQAVIAIENTRLFEAEQASKRELQEALEYQTATSEVLNVISRSPSQLKPVVEAIVQTAQRLCAAERTTMWRLHEDKFDLLASTNTDPALVQYLAENPIPTGRGSLAGRAVLEGRTLHVSDLSADPELGGSRQAQRSRTRTMLAIPLLREGEPLGVLSLSRAEVSPFTERQIELVATFADQAVIAIENTRLFEEVQTRTKELTESLEYQTATSDVLGVISRSPNELQPVLDAIVETAFGLCPSDGATIMLREADRYRFVAGAGFAANEIRDRKERAPVPVDRGSVVGRVALEGRTIHVQDVISDPDYTLWHGFQADRRTVLGVPLVRDGSIAGVIILFRTKVEPYSQRQIELVETFADQAVIAMNNARLFEEVQARNRELRTALEQQTATSELLKVIGRSTFQLQPVFDTLAENAVRLCSAERAFVHRFDGQFLRVVATYNVTPELRAFVERNPITPGRHSVAARGAFERRSVSIHDVQADPELTYAGRDVEPVRSALSVPMLRADELLGVIMIYRHEVRPFSDSQVALMETFADQAAIAIENTRLFEEVQARNRDLTALGEVGRAVSSTLDLKLVLKTIVDRAVALSGTDAGSIFYYRPQSGRFELGETTGLDKEIIDKFRKLDISAKGTGQGEAIAKRQPLELPDLTKRPSNPLQDASLEVGLRAALVVPLLGSDGPLGTLVLWRRQPGEFSTAVVSLMQAFADQSAIALENARLFEEIAQKSRELEIASQHKSQFVANMSHELRTPLAAILGYAELMQEGFYGVLSEKSTDALTRIRSNGKHLLGLINTVLDIAKIESGQFSLNLGEYAIESMVETVRSATDSLAETKKLALKTDVAKKLPFGLGDEQRLTQVLLNLVGNAIKFTDTGEVRITATAMNGHFTVAVTDTGPGIPAEELKRVFEQFHQIDNSNTKAKGGTGLGLAIAKQIVEMHGGRIWVESTLGQGATFQMQFPIRAEAKKAAE